jgi:quercetin dioxygenase-like cupin family protein
VNRKSSIVVALLGIGIGVPAGLGIALGDDGAKPPEEQGVIRYVPQAEMNWQRLVPELGEDSPEFCVVGVDEATGATQLYVRTPKKIHISRHWHPSHETNTLITGTMTFSCDRCESPVTQGPGDFVFIPSGCVHEVWASDDALLFIASTGPWALNWADGPPTAADLGLDPPAGTVQRASGSPSGSSPQK